MPELPEVETVRRGLELHMLGRRIREVELRRSDLRFPFPVSFAEKLQNCTIEGVDRRAKYLLIRLDEGSTWLCHLGMSGRWTILGDGIDSSPGRFANGAVVGNGDGPHDWVIVTLDNGTKAVYSDHRRFGYMDHFQTSMQENYRLLSQIGPEPTPEQLTPQKLASSLRSRRTPIKSALLDQRVVAGLGNIYVCEILHRSGISPKRSASSVAGKSGIPLAIERITGSIHEVIIEAIDAGGSTLQDFRGVNGEAAMGYFSHNFLVYGREGKNCLNGNCNGRVRRIIQSNRSTFYCSSCQH